MGVAPYSWPHEREWQPGIHDKRSNLGMGLVLIIYLLFFIGFSLNMGPRLLEGHLLVVFAFMVIVLWGVVAFFLVGKAFKRDVKVEDVKYFDVRPDRLSQLLVETLDMDRIGYTRDGPHQASEDHWEDTFHLSGGPWEGMTLVVERNPLISRVDTASVTVRGSDSSSEHLGKIKERVDGMVMRELIHRYERDMLKDRPELVVYGEETAKSLE